MAQRLAPAMRALLDAIGTPCVLCGLGRGAPHFCPPCLAELPGRHAHRCVQCGLRLALSHARCGRCLAETRPFDATFAAVDYVAPVDRSLTMLKFAGRLVLARAYAQLLGEALADAPRRLDLLTYVPLSAERLRERGFNQALEIARPVARARGLALASLLVKTRDTAHQADLPLEERQRNLHGVFACIGEVRRRHVAVVDDVMTTGSTLEEVARCLKRAGAASVMNLVVARTP